MLKKTTFLALAFCAALSQQSPAQESPANSEPLSLPGSVFAVPPNGESTVDPDIDQEISSDIDLFRTRGFKEPDWQTHTAQVDDILKDVVLPDWRRRTGNDKSPELPSIDVAAAKVLGGDFSDLLVMSRLPGDCTPEGCLFQMYSFVNEVWIKRFEFRTVGFAWKDDADDGAVVIAKVGGMWVPSQTLVWVDGRLQ
jgi:hypothetical protein